MSWMFGLVCCVCLFWVRLDFYCLGLDVGALCRCFMFVFGLGLVYGFILYVVLVLDSGWFELWLVVFVISLLVWGLVGVGL